MNILRQIAGVRNFRFVVGEVILHPPFFTCFFLWLMGLYWSDFTGQLKWGVKHGKDFSSPLDGFPRCSFLHISSALIRSVEVWHSICDFWHSILCYRSFAKTWTSWDKIVQSVCPFSVLRSSISFAWRQIGSRWVLRPLSTSRCWQSSCQVDPVAVSMWLTSTIYMKFWPNIKMVLWIFSSSFFWNFISRIGNPPGHTIVDFRPLRGLLFDLDVMEPQLWTLMIRLFLLAGWKY